MVHEIRVQTRASHEQALELRTGLAQEGARRHAPAVLALLAEHALEPHVESIGLVELVAGALAPVVLAERALVVAERLDQLLVAHDRLHTADVRHQLVDVFQLAQRRPALVLATPAGARLQPDGERLGEVLGRMALRVPVTEVQHEVAARGPRTIDVRVRARSLAERAPPLFAPADPVGVVERVGYLVTQNARHPVRVAAFDLAHEAALQALQAWMRHVERHGDAGHAVRREPFFGEPQMRAETDAARPQAAADLTHAAFDLGIAQRQPQIAETGSQQLGVGQAGPCRLAPATAPWSDFTS